MKTIQTMMLALALAGCGGSQATQGSPEAAPRAEATETTPSARDARPADLRLSVSAPDSTGVVAADHADEFPVHVDLTNEGAEPVMIRDAIARVSIERGGEIVCAAPDVGATTLAEDADLRLAPGETTRFQIGLPCALGETGDYDVLVSVLLAGEGEDFGAIAPTDPHLAASTRVDVTETDAPFGSHRPALAEVPPGDIQ